MKIKLPERVIKQTRSAAAGYIYPILKKKHDLYSCAVTAHRLYASGPRRPVSLLENPKYNHLESDPDEPIAY